MTKNSLVPFYPYRVINCGETPPKANPALSDEIWEKFQDLGALATSHLERVLSDARFQYLPIKDQMRVLDTAFARAYGSPDGAVRKHLHINAANDPNELAGYNAMKTLSDKAKGTLPEFKKPIPIDGEVLDDE